LGKAAPHHTDEARRRKYVGIPGSGDNVRNKLNFPDKFDGYVAAAAAAAATFTGAAGDAEGQAAAAASPSGTIRSTSAVCQGSQAAPRCGSALWPSHLSCCTRCARWAGRSAPSSCPADPRSTGEWGCLPLLLQL
jgi:hypothetical protein